MANYSEQHGLRATIRNGLIYDSKNGFKFKLELRDGTNAPVIPISTVLSIRGSDGLLIHESLTCTTISEVVTCELDELLDYDVYDFEWTVTTATNNELIVQRLALVEYPYFELVDLTAYRSGMSDVTPFSSFEELRDLVEGRFESMCNCVFRQSPASVENAEYVEPFTADVKRACILLAADLLNDKRPNATREVDEMGTTTNFVIGGTFGNLTNIPEVNEIISRIGRKSVTVLC